MQPPVVAPDGSGPAQGPTPDPDREPAKPCSDCGEPVELAPRSELEDVERVAQVALFIAGAALLFAAAVYFRGRAS